MFFFTGLRRWPPRKVRSKTDAMQDHSYPQTIIFAKNRLPQ